jgi:aryl-phospho-beta-D-glucosidase BglC (GH1 family)
MDVLPQSVRQILSFLCDTFSSNNAMLSIGWARKYGLRVILDLHALPGRDFLAL